MSVSSDFLFILYVFLPYSLFAWEAILMLYCCCRCCCFKTAGKWRVSGYVESCDNVVT